VDTKWPIEGWDGDILKEFGRHCEMEGCYSTDTMR
jgi:hypothetical protein